MRSPEVFEPYDNRDYPDDAEYDGLYFEREWAEKEIGRPLKDEEWYTLKGEIGSRLKETTWVIIESAIDELKEVRLMIDGMHEFFGVCIYRDKIEKEIGREISNAEWKNLINSIGTELDRVDYEITRKHIDALKGGN